MDLADVPKLTVKLLKKELKARNLDTSGLKAVLAARLTEAIKEEQAQKTSPTEDKPHKEDKNASVVQNESNENGHTAKSEEDNAKEEPSTDSPQDEPSEDTKSTPAPSKPTSSTQVKLSIEEKIALDKKKREAELDALIAQADASSNSSLSKKAQKRARRRARRKKNKNKNISAEGDIPIIKPKQSSSPSSSNEAKLEDYVSDTIEAPMAADFSDIFSKFKTPQQMKEEAEKRAEEEAAAAAANAVAASAGNAAAAAAGSSTVAPAANGLGAHTPAARDVNNRKLSKRERRNKNRLTIAELKQLVSKPDVVETHDCNSADPQLLVTLKSYRNTVQVPRHWCQKRKYLQNKRGIEKKPYELPEYIAATGIAEIRTAQNDRDRDKGMKQRNREKMQPKMGRIDIDFQVLHNAFFRFQTKPRMSKHGDLYFEGAEFEVQMKEKIPGELSPELRRALGMIDDTAPVPWLRNLQSYGPPPSYPNIRIPGVNYPIPPGARYGFGEGEWGKPPIDQYGRPLYGDVFGVAVQPQQVPVDTTPWGHIESDEEEESESEEEESSSEEEMSSDEDDEMDGIESTITGMDTPSVVQLRKKDGTGTETPSQTQAAPRQLYQVLEEKSAEVGSGRFGTDRTYVMPSSSSSSSSSSSAALPQKKKGQVDVTLTPEELANLDANTLKRKYSQQLEQNQAASNAERAARRAEMDEVFEEHQKKKRKLSNKKKGGFKF